MFIGIILFVIILVGILCLGNYFEKKEEKEESEYEKLKADVGRIPEKNRELWINTFWGCASAETKKRFGVGITCATIDEFTTKSLSNGVNRYYKNIKKHFIKLHDTLEYYGQGLEELGGYKLLKLRLHEFEKYYADLYQKGIIPYGL